MLSTWKITVAILGLIFLVGPAQAEFMPFAVGQYFIYDFEENGDVLFHPRIDIVSEEIIQGYTYFQVRLSNWERVGDSQEHLMRSTENIVYMHVEGVDYEFFKKQEIGTEWQYQLPGEEITYCYIREIISLDTPYEPLDQVYEIAKIREGDPYPDHEWWAEGIGYVGGYTTGPDGERRRILREAGMVPVPPSLVLFGSGLLGLLVWRRKTS